MAAAVKAEARHPQTLLHHMKEWRRPSLFEVFFKSERANSFPGKSAVFITGARSGSAYQTHTYARAHARTHTLREAMVNKCQMQ